MSDSTETTDVYKQTLRNSITQISAAVIVSSLYFHLGIGMAFATILLPTEMLVEQVGKENATDVDSIGKLSCPANGTASFTKEEASWITSLFALGCAFGSLTAGLIIDQWGRKMGCLVAGILYLIGWVLTLVYVPHIEILYVARFSCGCATGLSVSAYVYVSETTHMSLRSSMMSLSPVFSSWGILFTSILGYYLAWQGVAIFSAASIGLICVGISFIPESPVWLSLNIKDEVKRKERVSKSLSWLYKDQRILDQEIGRFKLPPQSEEFTEEKPTSSDKAGGILTKNWKISKLWKAIILLSTMFTFQEITGSYLLNFYAMQLFQASGTMDLDAWAYLMALSVVRLVTSKLPLFQFAGRKTLLLVSSLGMAVMILAASIWRGVAAPSIGPVICELVYAGFSGIGVSVVPWSLVAELLPNKYRGSVSGYMFCLNYVVMFITIRLFIIVLDFVGIVYILAIFGVLSVAMFIFVYFFIPETSGKSLSEIQEAL